MEEIQAVAQRCSVKKGILKLIRPQACNFVKIDTPAQMFSCDFCKYLRTPFYRTPLVPATEEPSKVKSQST